MAEKLSRVKCLKNDCFQNICGISCRLLTAPIKGHECPFYKTDAEVAEGRREAIQKLEKKGLFGLIEEYVYNDDRNW